MISGQLTVEGGAGKAELDVDQGDGARLDDLVAARRSLVLGALVLGVLAWGCAGDKLLSWGRNCHHGEGENRDDCELHVC